jgi:hypothetical protein
MCALVVGAHPLWSWTLVLIPDLTCALAVSEHMDRPLSFTSWLISSNGSCERHTYIAYEPAEEGSRVSMRVSRVISRLHLA